MELRSTEKETSSLSDLYQNIYSATIFSEYEQELRSWSSGSIQMKTIFSSSFITDHIPPWQDLVQKIETDPKDTENSAKDAAINVAEGTNKSTENKPTQQTMTLDSVLESLQSFQERVSALQPKIDRFIKRSKEVRFIFVLIYQNLIALHISYYLIVLKLCNCNTFYSCFYKMDPVTQAPRYGEKTMVRVKSVIQIYSALQSAAEIFFKSTCPLSTDTSTEEGPTMKTFFQIIQNALQEQKQYIQQKKEKEERSLQEEVDKQNLETQLQQNLMKQKEEEQRQMQLEREREIAQKANVARLAKEEQEKREKQAKIESKAAEEQYFNSIVKGEEGVQIQLKRLNQLREEKLQDYTIAIKSLMTIFKQIVSSPDNEEFRKIRKDHERFHQDIGRHEGGCELLIAAGFKMIRAEDDSFIFFLREPLIEFDMDAWSQWFDGLKSVLKLIEDAMLKK